MNDRAISGVRKATLTRYELASLWILGILEIPTVLLPLRLYTIERTWKGNENGISCIPPGPDEKESREYLFKWRTDSPKHGSCYEEWDNPATPEKEDVPGRANIQIHSANLADQLLGCIAVGLGVAEFQPNKAPNMTAEMQMGVTSSKEALRRMNAELGGALLLLKVCWMRDGSKPLPIVGGY